MIPDPYHDHAAIAAMQDHAETAWPEESLGVLVRSGDETGFVRGRLRYRPLQNVAPDPRAGFEGEPGSLAGAEAVVHSHPSGAAWPSRSDLESQAAAGVPYGVVPVTVSKEGRRLAGEPFWWPDRGRAYVGRPYRHGVTDCFTLVRDWSARERGVELPPVAYEWGWHESEPELDFYGVWRRRLGWVRVESAAARPGDLVLLAMAGSRVANHAGVLLEGGLLLHHPSPRPYDPTSLSRRTPAGQLSRYVVEVARPPEATG